MTPRKYELQARAEAAAATRQRIVQATMAVHQRVGITRATLREIAEEADVSPGTVLRHFPRMEDLVDACGTLSGQVFPFPTAVVLDGVTGDRARLRAAVAAIFGYWDAPPPHVWGIAEGERLHWPPVDRFVRADDAARRALLDAALPPRGSKRRARLLALALALTTWKSRAALRDEGFDLDAATDAVVDLLLPAGAPA